MIGDVETGGALKKCPSGKVVESKKMKKSRLST